MPRHLSSRCITCIILFFLINSPLPSFAQRLYNLQVAPPSNDTDEDEDKEQERCPMFNNSDIADVKSRILILPSDQSFEEDVRYWKALWFFFLMLYFFLGVSIASNIFMMSIEVICSKTKKISVTLIEDGVEVQEERHVTVWNDTVANLTLISLGTSAPEILLSLIETFGNDFCPGALGPGTIVGSATYNLMIISAICIISMPGETKKKIKEYKVFITTSAFALGAYIWLVIIIQVVSHTVVEWWEALITLLGFPALVGISFWAELDYCWPKKLGGKGRLERKKSEIPINLNQEGSIPAFLLDGEATDPLFHFNDEWDELLDENNKLKPATVRSLYQKLEEIAVLTDQEIATIIATKLIQYKGQSLLWYRIRPIQALLAGNRVFPTLNEKLEEVWLALNPVRKSDGGGKKKEPYTLITAPEILETKAVIEFNATCVAIPRFVGQFSVVMKRFGKEDVKVFCKLESYDGTAKQNECYIPVSEEFVFEPYVFEMKIMINMIVEQAKNKDSNFFLRLSLTKENKGASVTLGPMTVMEVVIMDSVEPQNPGEIQFVRKGQILKDTVQVAELAVERVKGADGPLKAKWRATPGPKCTRLAEVVEGELTFLHGEKEKILEVPINIQEESQGVSGENEQFVVEFFEVIEGSGKLGQVPSITVAISADETFKLKVNRVCQMTQDLIDMQNSIIKQTYVEQLKSAFIVNGTIEKAKKATKWDKVLHVISVPWKMIFMFLPQPYIVGGWPCFLLSLCVIGLLTALIGDMATIFGACLYLDPVTTAITFVAIGTSLPDTLASRIAALQSPYADAAIGNIMGSNSVNVFLGLGLPWTIASLYHLKNYNEGVKVHSQSLAFIVTIYTFCSVGAQSVLWLRRNNTAFGKAELGGPKGSKWLTGIGLIIGWLFYVIMSVCVSQRVEGISRLSIWLAKALKAT